MIEDFKSREVDVVGCIRKTVESGMIDKEFYVCEYSGYPLFEFADEDLELFSDDYFRYVEDLASGDEGVYVALCFASEENVATDEPFLFDCEGVGEDYRVFQGVSTWKDHVDVVLPSKYMYYSLKDSFGVFVSKNEQYLC